MLSLSLSSAARIFPALALALVLPAIVAAQEPTLPQAPQPAPPHTSQREFTVKDYSRPGPAFPNVLAPYKPQEVDAAKFSNTSRIEQLLQNGKLVLSMEDAIALALENNLDIAI